MSLPSPSASHAVASGEPSCLSEVFLFTPALGEFEREAAERAITEAKTRLGSAVIRAADSLADEKVGGLT